MSNSSSTDGNVEISIEEEERLHFLANGIPVTVYLVILCLVGTSGNALTLLVYAVRFKQSIHRTFILWLGTVDLIACSISIPYVLYDSTHPYTFTSTWACKCFVFINFAFSAYSPLLLDLIAIERYRRVCKPTARQLTVKDAQIISALLGAFVVLTCCPFFAIYGISSTVTDISGIQGFQCNVIAPYRASLFESVYFGLLFSVFIFLFLLCIVLYSLIGRKLMESEKFRKSTKTARRLKKKKSMRIIEQAKQQGALNVEEQAQPVNEQNPSIESTVSVTSQGDTDELEPNAPTDDALDEKPLERNRHLENCELKISVTDASASNNFPGNSLRIGALKDDKNSMEKNDKCAKNGEYCKTSVAPTNKLKRFVDRNISKKKVNQMISKSKRVTLMFLVVSVLSFGGYLPYFAHVILRNVNDDLRRDLAVEFGAIGPIMRYSFFLNNAVNPVVYGFMDKNFRDQFRRMIRRCRRNRIDFT